MTEYSKLIEKISKSPSIEVRYFRDYWKDLFPWVLPGPTNKSDLTCLYCSHCHYECHLRVKKNSLNIHQKTKKHQHAEIVAKEDGIFIETRKEHLSCNGSDDLNVVTIKKNLISKSEQNLEIDRCMDVEKQNEVIQNQFLPPDKAVEKQTEVIQNQFLPPSNEEDLVTTNYELDRPCSRLAHSPTLSNTVITTEELSSEKENFLENRCPESEAPIEDNQEDRFSSDSDNCGSDYFDLDEIVSKVTKSFKIDLMQLMRKDKNLREEIFKKKNVSKDSEKGLDFMTKLVVNQLSHKYLTENINEQWETGCPSYTTKSLSSQFSAIEQQINQSYEELHKLQTQGIFERAHSPPEQIIVEAVDYSLQEGAMSSVPVYSYNAY